MKKTQFLALVAFSFTSLMYTAPTPILAQDVTALPEMADDQITNDNVRKMELVDDKQKEQLKKNLQEISSLRRASIPEEMEKNRARIQLLRKQFRESIVQISEQNFRKNADPEFISITNQARRRVGDRSQVTRPEDLIASGLYQNNSQSYTIGTAYEVLLEINQDFIDREASVDSSVARRDIYLQQSIYVSELCAFLADEIDYLSNEGLDDIRTAVKTKKATLISLKNEIENDPTMGESQQFRNIMQSQISAINDMLRAWGEVEREADEKEGMLGELKEKKKDFEMMRVVADRQIRIIEELGNLEIVMAALKRVDELANLDSISILVLPTDFVNEYLTEAFPKEQK